MQGSLINRCSFVDRDCGSSLLRTTRINSTHSIVDTVMFPLEAALPNTTVNSSRIWPVRGSGAAVCYSGLQASFGDEGDRVLSNHVALIISPLVRLFAQQLYLAFDAADRNISRNVYRAAMEAGVPMANILEEPREGPHPLMPVRPGGGNDSVTQCAVVPFMGDLLQRS